MGSGLNLAARETSPDFRVLPHGNAVILRDAAVGGLLGIARLEGLAWESRHDLTAERAVRLALSL